MRFTRLTAHAHGPFTGQTLTPAPGLTVVWGLNEAGKSSWHSAAHLAITGLTRKRGRPPKGEQQTIDRCKPRAGDQWRLEAGLRLDDGDDLTVTWDLTQRVAKVLDGLGRDRSNQWLTDGAPDLTRIVGLDRASFMATACVRQADLQRVRDDASLLQELLQKATTSADADVTASTAIALIAQFRREQVGLERENSTKPLMEARRGVETTRQALHAAQTAHRIRLDLLAELTAHRTELAARADEHQMLRTALALATARHHHDQLVQQHDDLDAVARRVDTLTNQLQSLHLREQVLLAARNHAERVDALRTIEREIAEDAVARRSADAADHEHRDLHRRLLWLEHEQARRTARLSRQRTTRIAELQHRHPAAPSHPVDHDQLAHQAHVLIDRWNQRPASPSLAGPTAIELEQQLAAVDSHTVATDISPSPPRRAAAERSGDSHEPWVIGATGAAGAIGIALLGLALGIVVHPALHLLALAGAVAALIALHHRSRPADPGDATTSEFHQRLERAEAAGVAGQQATLSAQLVHRRSQEQQMMDVQAVLGRLGCDITEMTGKLDADPSLSVGQQADRIQRWLTEHTDRRRHVQAAHDEWAELTNLLGGATAEDLAVEADQDERLRQERASMVHGLDPCPEDLRSFDGPTLKSRTRQLAEANANAARQATNLRRQVATNDPAVALAEARHDVVEAAHHLHRLDVTAADHLVGWSVDDVDVQLSTCRRQRDLDKQNRDEAAGQLRHLQHVRSAASGPTALGLSPPPGDIADPDAASDPVAAARQVLHLEDRFFAQPAHTTAGFTLDALPPTEILRSHVQAVAEQEDRLHHLVAGLEGRLQERDVPGVGADPATATENHEAARRELIRVQELADVLDETRSLLEAAEERVHRDIAPRLNASVDRWLPRIFGGRYTKVLIDPATLDVQVFAAGDAHRADLLSQGTTEQFYLLLRVALTETLTAASGESCPLLLDDITVNFDRERTVAVLELLRQVATERQVILFTQEDDVRTWATTNLSMTDTLIELSGRVCT